MSRGSIPTAWSALAAMTIPMPPAIPAPPLPPALPRARRSLSIYVLPGYGDFGPILQRLGKHRAGKACLYLRRLADADEGVLRELIAAGLADLRITLAGRAHMNWTFSPAA